MNAPAWGSIFKILSELPFHSVDNLMDSHPIVGSLILLIEIGGKYTHGCRETRDVFILLRCLHYRFFRRIHGYDFHVLFRDTNCPFFHKKHSLICIIFDFFHCSPGKRVQKFPSRDRILPIVQALAPFSLGGCRAVIGLVPRASLIGCY